MIYIFHTAISNKKKQNVKNVLSSIIKFNDNFKNFQKLLNPKLVLEGLNKKNAYEQFLKYESI